MLSLSRQGLWIVAVLLGLIGALATSNWASMIFAVMFNVTYLSPFSGQLKEFPGSRLLLVDGLTFTTLSKPAKLWKDKGEKFWDVPIPYLYLLCL